MMGLNIKKILVLLFLLTSIMVNASIVGDVNSDGMINSLDYILVRRHLLNMSQLTNSQQKLADMNNDNEINALDYILIRKAILNGGSNVNVTSIALNKSSASLNVGESITLLATISPDNATDKSVIWSSSNNGVATVDTNGKITAVNKGNAIITVTINDGSKKATCQVTVLQPIDLVLMWGQSNMVGRAGTESELKLTVNKTELLKVGVDKDIVNNTKSYGRVELSMKKNMAYEYKAKTNELIDISTNPLKFGEYYTIGNASSGSVGLMPSLATNMIPYFVKEYTERTNHKIAVAFAAHTGLGISNFMPSANNNLYQAIVQKYKLAENYLKSNNYVINNRFYVVYQGESDCNANDATNYEKRYLNVHNNLSKDLNLSFGAMVYIVRGVNKCDDQYVQLVRQAQKKMVKEKSNIIMGTDFPYQQFCVKNSTAIFGDEANRMHLNATGLSQVGRDIAKHVVASGKIK